jgi:hypothetical protein
VPENYIDPEELAEWLGDSSGKLPAAILARACEATSRAIDLWCGQRFYLDASATARLYRPRAADVLRVDPIGSATGLAVATDTTGDGTFVTVWASSDYQLEPLNADADGTPYSWWELAAIGDYTFPVTTTSRRPLAQVTARWGWSDQPADVGLAGLIKATSLFKRKDAPYGVAGFGDFGAVRISKKDPDVIALLSPFVRGQVDD